MDDLTLNIYHIETAISVVRQLKIISQIDAFKISAAKNIQFVLNKLVCLIISSKDAFDIYLNNISH